VKWENGEKEREGKEEGRVAGKTQESLPSGIEGGEMEMSTLLQA